MTREILAQRHYKTVVREGRDVLKIFAPEWPKENILNEAHNQAMVEATGLPVPELLEVCKIDGSWAIRSRYIEGATLQELLERQPEREEELMARFLDTQLQIFSKAAPRLYVLKEKMKMQLDQSDYDYVLRYELKARLNSLPDGRQICHGDFQPSNLVVDEEDRIYILDWSHVSQGTPAADAALTYLLFKLKGEDERGETYLRAFCERTGIEKRVVQRWMPVVAAAQSTRAAEEEKDFLGRWANVAEYQ